MATIAVKNHLRELLEDGCDIRELASLLSQYALRPNLSQAERQLTLDTIEYMKIRFPNLMY